MARILEVKIRSFEKFRELLEAEAKLEALTRKVEALRRKLLPIVKRARDVEFAGHHFVFQRRANYRFSEKVAKLMARVAAQKRYEIENGEAEKIEPTEYFMIKGG